MTVVLGKSSVPTCWAWSCVLSVPVYLLTVLLWPLWTMPRFLFWGEIELAYQCGLGKLAAIHGNQWKDYYHSPHRGDIKGPL